MEAKHIEKLRSLAQLDVDAIGAYEAAMKGVTDEAVQAKLAEFRVDHARHVQDLNSLIVRFGGEAVQMSPDLKGTIMKVMTQFTGILGTEAALLAMVANEEVTNRSYDAAMKVEWEDDEVRSLIERNQGDERRHLAWIKQAIRERPWERSTEVHP